MQILYQKVGLTPNGGPGSVAGLSTSGCMCVYVCVCVCVASGSTSESAKVQNHWGHWKNLPKHTGSPVLGPLGPAGSQRMRGALLIPGVSLPQLPSPQGIFGHQVP